MSPVWTFGDRLARIRKAMKLSQAEISTLIGVSQKTIGRWENDAHVRDPHDVAIRYERAAREMGLPEYSYDWIMGRSDAGHLQFPNSQEICPTPLAA